MSALLITKLIPTVVHPGWRRGWRRGGGGEGVEGVWPPNRSSGSRTRSGRGGGTSGSMSDLAFATSCSLAPRCVSKYSQLDVDPQTCTQPIVKDARVSPTTPTSLKVTIGARSCPTLYGMCWGFRNVCQKAFVRCADVAWCRIVSYVQYMQYVLTWCGTIPFQRTPNISHRLGEKNG